VEMARHNDRYYRGSPNDTQNSDRLTDKREDALADNKMVSTYPLMFELHFGGHGWSEAVFWTFQHDGTPYGAMILGENVGQLADRALREVATTWNELAPPRRE